MSTQRTATQILDREFLELRARLLELAASFDRMERADENCNGDRRMELIIKGLAILSNDSENKAPQIQQLFSREYSSSWRQEFEV